MTNPRLTIDLTAKSKWKWIARFGLLMQGLCLLALISLFAYVTYLAFVAGIIFGMIVTGLMLFLLYLFKRFIELNSFFEQVIVSSNDLTISIKSMVSKKTTTIPLKDIEYFGPVTADFYNDQHSPFIQTYVMDRTNLGVYHERQNLVDNGGMEIRTAKKKIRFGKNMVSWDVENIVRQVESHTGIYFNAG